MIVRTFTSTWNLRTKIYAFDDIKVPIKGGITVPQLIAGALVAGVWVPAMLCIGLPSLVGNTGIAAVIMLGPPILAVMKADTPVKHEKTVEEWASSMATRMGEPKKLASLTGARDDRPLILTASRWVPEASKDFGREPREIGR